MQRNEGIHRALTRLVVAAFAWAMFGLTAAAQGPDGGSHELSEHIPVHGGYQSNMATSADGRWLAIFRWNRLDVFDFASRKIVLTEEGVDNGYRPPLFTRNGERLIYFDDRGLVVRKHEDGAWPVEFRRHLDADAQGRMRAPHSLSFDESRILTVIDKTAWVIPFDGAHPQKAVGSADRAWFLPGDRIALSTSRQFPETRILEAGTEVSRSPFYIHAVSPEGGRWLIRDRPIPENWRTTSWRTSLKILTSGYPCMRIDEFEITSAPRRRIPCPPVPWKCCFSPVEPVVAMNFFANAAFLYDSRTGIKQRIAQVGRRLMGIAFRGGHSDFLMANKYGHVEVWRPSRAPVRLAAESVFEHAGVRLCGDAFYSSAQDQLVRLARLIAALRSEGRVCSAMIEPNRAKVDDHGRVEYDVHGFAIVEEVFGRRHHIELRRGETRLRYEWMTSDGEGIVFLRGERFPQSSPPRQREHLVFGLNLRRARLEDGGAKVTKATLDDGVQRSRQGAPDVPRIPLSWFAVNFDAEAFRRSFLARL